MTAPVEVSAAEARFFTALRFLLFVFAIFFVLVFFLVGFGIVLNTTRVRRRQFN